MIGINAFYRSITWLCTDFLTAGQMFSLFVQKLVIGPIPLNELNIALKKS